MKSRPLFILFAIAALMLACNLPTTGGVVSPTATQSSAAETLLAPTETQPAETPTETETPVPSDTPTITPTPTPSVPMVTPSDQPVNCRYGPSTYYQPIGALTVGNSAQILGKSSDGGWWQIPTPSGSGSCWVASSVTIASGDLSGISVVSPPAPFVTDVGLTIDPDKVTVPGCVFPYSPVNLHGTIAVNGPVKVTWHWEDSDGHVTADDYLNFSSFGSKNVDDVLSYGSEGDYWVKLVVTYPNSMQAQATFKVVCGP